MAAKEFQVRIDRPCNWIIERLRNGIPFFTTRINDGEMICMYRTRPEGSPLGTVLNPAPVRYDLGDELKDMVSEILSKSRDEDILVGHCCHDDPEHELNKRFWADYGTGLSSFPETGGHWPLDGVVNGSTARLLDEIRRLDKRPILVTCEGLKNACHCLASDFCCVASADSWMERETTYNRLKLPARGGRVFTWCAGIGLKTTAWRLFKEFPQSSHIDLGHLFNGAFGMKDYGWLERGDGPWYQPYFKNFAPYVRSFLP